MLSIGIKLIYNINLCCPLQEFHLVTDIMAGVAGLKPADVGVKVPCLNQLGYTPII